MYNKLSIYNKVKMEKFINQTEFAKLLGNKSKQYITKLKNQNKLVFNENGLIDVEKSLLNIKKNSDPSKLLNGNNSKTKKENNKDNFIKDIPKEIKGDLTNDEIEDILKNEDPSDFNQSKSRKEYYLSKIAELNFLKESGKLIETELVELQYFNISRLLRDKIFNIKYRISSQLSIMTDPTEISNLLEKEFRMVFGEVEKELEKEIKNIEDIENDEE